jgi:hypothetical protein
MWGREYASIEAMRKAWITDFDKEALQVGAPFAPLHSVFTSYSLGTPSDLRPGRKKGEVIGGTMYVNKMHRLGYFPIMSTFTGFGRALIGLSQLVALCWRARFPIENQLEPRKEARLASRNVFRGTVEMLPVIGNIIMLIADTYGREAYIWEARKLAPSFFKIPSLRKTHNCVALVFNGKNEGTAALSILKKRLTQRARFFGASVSDLVAVMKKSQEPSAS